MNNIFKFISTILMVILILILVWVLVSYYREEPVTFVSPTNNINVVSTDQVGSIVDELGKDDNNTPIDDVTPIENNKTSEDNSQENIPTEPNTTDPLVIESTIPTSNSEKQEILSEIDKTLMELLEVVDKVKPIDETRLEGGESEVQE